MRLIHTADWQIGKPFSRFGEKADRLRTARLDAIEALGRLAVDEAATHVLVAGDIFDSDAPATATLRQPLERMRGFPAVQWHLMPGNHDCHRPGGVWERLQALGLPANVRPLLSPEPIAIDERTWLLPAPLTSRTETRDLTAGMEHAGTPEGATRIGLAHGSVTNFKSEGDATNPIDPNRADKAGLAYIGLGDWHRTQEVNARTWYAGTPEPDRHDSQTVGQALVVAVRPAGAVPTVEPRTVGTFRWRADDLVLSDAGQLPDWETRLRGSSEPLSRLILKLSVSGIASLGLHQEVEQWRQRLEASLCHLDCDIANLRIRPERAELETIDFDGVLHQVAERLSTRIDDPSLTPAERRTAEDALVRLYVEAQAAGDLPA